MNILIINHYAGSPEMGMEFRPYYLAREWQKLGHKVLIVGGTYSHLRKKQPDQEGRQTINGVDYLWVKTPVYHGNGVKRLLSMFVLTAKLWFRAGKIAAKVSPDVVIASSTYPLDNYPARRIACKSGGKYIYEIHDLWPLSPMELGGMSKRHPFIVLMQMAENYAYKHCDAVVSILPKAKEHCTAHGLPENRFFHVPNGIVEDDWQNVEDLPEECGQLIAKLKAENRFIVGYVGGHALSNGLNVLLDTAKRLINSNIAFVLVGDGTEKKQLQQRVENENIRNVYFVSPIHKMAVPSFLRDMDVLYIGWNKNPLYRFGISPNKIFDYMMSGKPIVHAVEAGNDPVAEANCGLSVEAENPQAIAEAILKLKEMPAAEREQLGINGQNYVMKHHTYSVLAKKFSEIMQSLAKEKKI
ncbi:MAG: glycosyltransferase family 4 protein [Bacteroidales bacterium]|nr:glycosyltransferase family 4 protein [Bacteroidales bacterium]